MKHLLISTAFFAALANPAAAYTAFLLPQAFWPAGASVTVDAGYAQQFFAPQIAIGGTYQVIGPTADAGIISGMEIGANATHLTLQGIPGGTYHVSTGEVLGQVVTLVGTADGQWRQLGAGETPPADAPTTTLQTVTVADSYFTRGAPSRTAVDHTIGRLAIHPIGDPNQIVQSQGFVVEILFDGQPMANAPVIIYAAGDADSKLDRFVTTDATGRATLTFDQPGQYVLAVQRRANAPAGSAAAVQSFTTTTTIDVMAEAHATSRITDAPTQQTQHHRPGRFDH